MKPSAKYALKEQSGLIVELLAYSIVEYQAAQLVKAVQNARAVTLAILSILEKLPVL